MKKLALVLLSITLSLLGCSKDSTETAAVVTPTPTPTPAPVVTDWKLIEVPADAGTGKKWEFQDMSDDFNYDAPADNKGATFLSKWTDFYHNAWTGPGLTVWSRSFSLVKDGFLQIPTARVTGSATKMNMGCITSTKRVLYPVYVEVKMKIMNSTLASNTWLLSPDDTQEIDIVEAYGSSFSEKANADLSYFAKKIHLSHHVFIRTPFADYQPTDSGTWYSDNANTLWRNDYHRYGVYWIDPWTLEYYIDGQKVRTISGKNLIDPKFYTNSVNQGDTSNDTRTGLSKEMDIIINTEDQDWRSNQNHTPTDNELSNKDNHTLKVDWIRIYKPVNN